MTLEDGNNSSEESSSGVLGSLARQIRELSEAIRRNTGRTRGYDENHLERDRAQLKLLEDQQEELKNKK